MNRIKVIQGDITKLKVDAIVNAANDGLTPGSGVNAAIQRVGGSAIAEACEKIGACPTGEAVITTAGKLPSKFVIHAVGPVWRGGTGKEDTQLASAYQNSLKRAIEHNVRSVAFPNISTGIFSFPKERAASIAINSVRQFLQNNNSLNEVIFCCYDEENFNLYNKLLTGKEG